MLLKKGQILISNVLVTSYLLPEQSDVVLWCLETYAVASLPITVNITYDIKTCRQAIRSHILTLYKLDVIVRAFVNKMALQLFSNYSVITIEYSYDKNRA